MRRRTAHSASQRDPGMRTNHAEIRMASDEIPAPISWFFRARLSVRPSVSGHWHYQSLSRYPARPRRARARRIRSGHFASVPQGLEIKNPLFPEGVFVYLSVRIRSLTMTYFHRRGAYYHWRGSVSPSCSGWEGVVPLCYGRQTKGWESGFVVLTPHSDCLGCC